MDVTYMEASYYKKLDKNMVRCLLCPNLCRIADGGNGTCRIRSNRGGTLDADAYGKVVTMAIDPIEKKPLYHFHPSKPILSTGVNGCNFHCGFCQNSDISQGNVPTRYVSPEDLARMAMSEGSIGVAYTYTEPFIWFEYVRDAGILIHDQGQVNVLVTNGYVSEEPLRVLLPLIDAMNVDVKSMKQDFYGKVCGGKLEDVLRTVEIAAGSCHIEITNLIITNYNDTDDDFRQITDWVASINPAIPIHFSRYFPQHRFTEPATSEERLKRAYEIASEKLDYVYVGNVSIPGTSDTSCPRCGNILVRRSYYNVDVDGIVGGACSECGRKSDIIGV